MPDPTPYSPIFESIFFKRYARGVKEIPFDDADIIAATLRFNVRLPKNASEVISRSRYGLALPLAITSTASRGRIWRIRPVAAGGYRFVLEQPKCFSPRADWAWTNVCDKTPGIVVRHALSREEDLLARVRHNRLLDLYRNHECHSLQCHVKGSVPYLGAVETDEVYISVDRQGTHFVHSVYAARTDGEIDSIQAERDLALCEHLFPGYVCRSMAVQLTEDNVVVLFDIAISAECVALNAHKYCKLIPPDYEAPGKFAGREASSRRVAVGRRSAARPATTR